MSWSHHYVCAISRCCYFLSLYLFFSDHLLWILFLLYFGLIRTICCSLLRCVFLVRIFFHSYFVIHRGLFTFLNSKWWCPINYVSIIILRLSSWVIFRFLFYIDFPRIHGLCKYFYCAHRHTKCSAYFSYAPNICQERSICW